MQLSNRAAIKALNACAILGQLQQVGQLRLHVTTGLQLARLQHALEDVTKPTEKVRQQTLDKHAQKDEKGRRVIDAQKNVVFEDQQAADKELNDLMDAACEVDIKPFKLPTVMGGKCEKCGHNMDTPFDPPISILEPLLPFLEE